MKPAFERTPQRQWESLHCDIVRGPSYNATWHFHPEYQLTLVLKSSGYRLVGDKISPLENGDLVLLGANLPHVWQQDGNAGSADAEVHAIIIRFQENFLGRDFLDVPEMEAVLLLLNRANRGLRITGKTRDTVATELERLAGCRGLERIARLLFILDLLAHSPELAPIASADFEPSLSRDDQGRVERIIRFIHEHLTEPIDRNALAADVHMSIGAFSRYFKLRLGKTLPEYINELRVGRACRLLANEQSKVTDVAFDCGFLNLGNFNRSFRKITGKTPREYRRQLQLFGS